MGWTVEWDPPAEDELTRLWLRAPDRNAVTAAQAQIDQLLARDPLSNGRHISEGLFRIDVPPLTVNYTIDQTNRRVEVTWVRRSP
jgi:hypothetical protein